MAAGMLTIDGFQGEGGGQVLRSSLALSLVTGRLFVIEGTRTGRKKPGLLRQQLTAVSAQRTWKGRRWTPVAQPLLWRFGAEEGVTAAAKWTGVVPKNRWYFGATAKRLT